MRAVSGQPSALGRGFTLLEVLFAVALFGAIVTVILSAQAGLVASNRSSANLSQAIEIGRCRMSELEERLLKLGYPEIEEKDEAAVCCDDKEVPGFSCDWQVERVTLPDSNPNALSGEGGVSSLLGGALGLDAGAPSATSGSLPTDMGSVAVNPLGGAQLNLDGGLQGMGNSLLQGQFGGGAGGAQGLLTMVFALVYPSLKPILESAIRRITVTIHWKEGGSAREFALVQYVTNPLRAGLAGGIVIDGGVLEGGAPPNGGGGGGPPNSGGSFIPPTQPHFMMPGLPQ